MHNLRGERLIFVGGSPRSGTTLLQNILDSHPEICGGPEFQHLPDIIELRTKMHQSVKKQWIDLFCSDKDVDELISSLIEGLLLPLADKRGRRLLSEKTPANILVFPQLMELFPRARFIHMVRDPRAIIASMLQVGMRAQKQLGRPTNSYVAHISTCIRHAKRCLSAGFAAARLNPERILSVVYEQLVTDPERETKRMCDFLAIEWCSQMMYPESVKHPGEKAIVNDIWYDKTMYSRNPETNDIDKWKNQLSPVQQVLVARSFRDINGLIPLGYDFSVDGLSRMSRALGLMFSLLQKIPERERLRRWLQSTPIHAILGR